MAVSSSSDVFILALGVVLAALYLFRDQLFAVSKPKSVPIPSSKAANGSGNPRDFIAKMKEGVSQPQLSKLLQPLTRICLRKSALSFFTAPKQVQQRNTPSGLRRRPSPSSVLPLLYVILKNMTLRTSISYLPTALPSSSWPRMARANRQITLFSSCRI